MLVDLRALWSIGRGAFAMWFTAAILLGTFVFIRCTTRLTLIKSVAAAMAMTGVSSFFVAAQPVSFVVSLSIESRILRGQNGPLGCVLAIVLSAFVGATSGTSVLVAFRQRISRTGLAILFGINLFCVGLAFYRMVAYVIAHPPEA